MTEDRTTPQPDDGVEDLDVPEADAEDVKGGRKAGKGQQEYLVVKMNDITISGTG
jgi:hypothetical protein